MSITLYRIDPARNMHRFYHLDVQPDLFGTPTLIRQWGRIGRSGRLTIEAFASTTAAQAALDRQKVAKERRGYVQDVIASDLQ
jgi:predicted DNA-binding WGR domain protein